MSKDALLNRVSAFLANQPDTPMHEESRKLLREDPLEWSISRNRILRAALLAGDMDEVEPVKDDVAHVVGLEFTEWWYMSVMEKIVAQSLMDQQMNPKSE